MVVGYVGYWREVEKHFIINDKQLSEVAVLIRHPPFFILTRSAIELFLFGPASDVIAQMSGGKYVVGIRV